MDELQTKQQLVAAAAKAAGLSGLAAEAEVPLTTLRSFADRGWTNKNLLVFEKLVAAARRIQARKGAA